MKDKTPIYIQVKIPTGSEYSGYKEKGDARVEEYHVWDINDWGRERPELKGEAKKNELLISKEGENFTIEFRKNYALDPRYKETRDAHGWIAYRLPKEKMEKLWDSLKNNPSAAYDLIDPELLKLIGLPSDLEVVLKEEWKRLEVKKKEDNFAEEEKIYDLGNSPKEFEDIISLSKGKRNLDPPFNALIKLLKIDKATIEFRNYYRSDSGSRSGEYDEEFDLIIKGDKKRIIEFSVVSEEKRLVKIRTWEEKNK